MKDIRGWSGEYILPCEYDNILFDTFKMNAASGYSLSSDNRYVELFE